MDSVLMGFVGDVHVNREDPQEAFADIQSVLRVPAILFGNLEGAYTEDQSLIGSFNGLVCTPASTLDVYHRVGFNVMALANNHAIDAGYQSMLKTQSRLLAQGIQTCGAGANVFEARRPAILESNGISVAFLGYTSIFPFGWEARSDAPGIAPLRAQDSWSAPFPHLHAPGMPPLITTTLDDTDMAYIADDIRRARDKADLVIVSIHGGDQTSTFTLGEHEVRAARHFIDHGAHMVVGHHHHALRGMEWYKGRPIMYGLGHFVFDVRWEWSEGEVKRLAESEMGRYLRQVNYDGGPREGWPLLAFPEEFRMNILAWATATKDGIREFGFLPCILTSDGLVHPCQRHSMESDQVVDYLNRCNKRQSLNGRIVADGAVDLAGFHTFRIVEK